MFKVIGLILLIRGKQYRIQSRLGIIQHLLNNDSSLPDYTLATSPSADSSSHWFGIVQP